MMRRIIWHWSAGTHKASATDKEHYHVIIEGNGNVVYGDLKPEANLNTSDGKYAAHTRGTNTGSIGLAVAAMHGAQERPFNTGKHPITKVQLEALVKETAALAETYGIPVTRETTLSHAEVQRTLGRRQRAKWDITWLPGMTAPGDAIEVGDRLREMISEEMAAHRIKVRKPSSGAGATLVGGGLLAFLAAFGCKLPFAASIISACGG